MLQVGGWVAEACFRFVVWRCGQQPRFVRTLCRLTGFSSATSKQWSNARVSSVRTPSVTDVHTPFILGQWGEAFCSQIIYAQEKFRTGVKEMTSDRGPIGWTYPQPSQQDIYLLIQSRHKEIAFKLDACQCICHRSGINHTARFQAINQELPEKSLHDISHKKFDLRSAFFFFMLLGID